MSHADRFEMFGFYSRLAATAATMPHDDRQRLRDWELKNLPRQGTSDWPGWANYADALGPIPARLSLAWATC